MDLIKNSLLGLHLGSFLFTFSMETFDIILPWYMGNAVSALAVPFL